MKNLILSCSIFLVILLASTHEVLACSCARSPTVDVAFQQTANVVIVKLRSVEKYTEGETGYGYGRVRQARLTVEKVYKGGFKTGEELTFAQGGGADCVWTFSDEDIGDEYLFYLGAKPVKPNLWFAGTCGRSNSRAGGAADMLYLDKLDSVKGKTRLSGRVTQAIASAVEGDEADYRLLSGRKIIVTGNGKTIELLTDAKGVYEVYGLTPGKYTVTPEGVEGYKFNYPAKQKSLEVVITAASHTEANIDFEIDNRISGRFFDAKGQPLKNVCLRLRPASGKDAVGLFQMDCTHAAGRFSMDSIPTGTYVLVINEDDQITADQPFPKFFYPSAKRREDAAELTIGPGEFYEDLIVNAPETTDVITVTGVLLLEDGKRATDKNTEYVSIEFFVDKGEKGQEADADPEARSQIDATGRFTIRILKGQRGTLSASMMTFAGKYVNCPKMEKLIRQAGKESMPTIRSTEVRIDGVANVADVELKFPFPTCRMATID